MYHYAGNNPVRYTDPDGKQSLPVFDLWKFLNLTDDPQIKILNTMKAADDGDQYAMDALKYVFHEASKQLLEESSSKMNDMSLICLCIGAPEGSAVFGTAATICDVILAFDKAINGEIKDAIKDGVYIVAGMVISEKIEKGVSKFSKGIQITVGENGRFYELAGKNPIKSEYALRKLIQKDIADGYFGKQILPNSQLIIEEAIKAYKKLKEVVVTI